MMNVIRKVLILMIKAYQYVISPLLGPNCRFYPSCSSYTVEAFEKLPLHMAFIKSIVRISKCHPFHPGGHDPVIKDSEK